MRIDRRNVPALLCGCALLCALAPVAIAHFRLLAPASWIEEGQYGDPQWLGPCGGTAADPGKPTGALTKVQGGEKLHIRIREMAYHPGFYRVALAVNSRDEYPARPPVLADGLFPHTAPFDKDQEADVLIPNINCSRCTLQVIEFMADHSRNKEGDFTYHHCAVLQVQANPNQPIDTRFPAEKK
jgi:hypothetical protein